MCVVIGSESEFAASLSHVGVLIAVEDLHVEELEVIHVEVVVVLHRSVEGEAEWQSIHVAGAVTDAAADDGIVAGVLLDSWLVIGVDHVEELVDLATLLSLGQHQAVGHAAVGLGLVQLKLVVAVGGIHQFLVKLEVGGAVVDPEAEVAAAALDVIDASLQLNLEVLQFKEVLVVVFQRNLMTVLVVLGSDEDLDYSRLGLVRGNVQDELERLVVEALLAGLDDKAGAVVERVATESVESLSWCFPCRFHVDSVADVCIEVLEVCCQGLGHVDGVDLDSLKAVVGLRVHREGLHQVPVVGEQVLVHFVEQWVADRGVVVHEGSRVCLAVLTERSAFVDDVTVPFGQAAVVLLVDAVHVTLDHVTQLVDDVDIVLVVLVDPVHDALRVELNVLHVLHILRVVEVVVVSTAGVGNAVVAAQTAVETSLDRLIHVEAGNLAQVVGETLKVVTCQQLPVHIEVELATTVRVQFVHLIALAPERIVQVEVVVEAVEAYVLQVIGQSVLVVHVAVVVSVVGLHNNVVDIIQLLDVMEAVHLVVLSHLQGLAVEEAPRMDLVLGGHHDTLHIVTEQIGNGEGVDEQLLVHMLASPEDDVLVGLPVLGEVEETHQADGVWQMAIVHNGPNLIVSEGMVLPQLEEVLQLLSMVIVVDVFPGLVLVETAVVLLCKYVVLVDVLQNFEDKLLLHQKVTVRHLGLNVLAMATKCQQRQR